MSTDGPSITKSLRRHAETLGSIGKPASRQLLIEAAEEIERLRAELTGLEIVHNDTTNEVASVLMLMDGLADLWGDEAVFRRCRDRLRKLTGEPQ